MGNRFNLYANLNKAMYTDFFDDEYYMKIMHIIAQYFGAKNVRIIFYKNQNRPDDSISLNGFTDPKATVTVQISDVSSIEIIRPRFAKIFDKRALLYISQFLGNILKLGDKITDLQTDKLTGLMNNNTLIELINEPCIRYNIGVLFLDANDLRFFNNTYGHSEGDRLLITLAECMRRSIRKKELFRRGGDEFVAVCQNIPEDLFFRKIEEIRQSIAQTQYSAAMGSSYRTVCSDLEVMINEADARMYDNKAAMKAAGNPYERVRKN